MISLYERRVAAAADAINLARPDDLSLERSELEAMASAAVDALDSMPAVKR